MIGYVLDCGNQHQGPSRRSGRYGPGWSGGTDRAIGCDRPSRPDRASGSGAGSPTDGQVYSRKGSTASWVVAATGGGGGDVTGPAGAVANNIATYNGATGKIIKDGGTAIASLATVASVPVPATVAPIIDGTATVGVATKYAREDHIHPTDTSRAAVSALPVAATATPLVAAGTGAVGAATKYAREDHVHPAGGGGGGATVISSDTPPVGAADNSLWYETDTGLLFIRVNDGNSTQWVLVIAATTGGTGASGGIVVQGPADLKAQTVTQSGASLAINRTLAENCALSLTASITAITVTGWPASGTTGKVRLVIANTGAFAISGWPTGTIWPGGTAPTITSGAGKKDIVLLMSDDGGATIFGSVIGQDYR